jgi:hypothetical protein
MEIPDKRYEGGTVVNRREFLAAAVAAPGVTTLAESMGARGAAPLAASKGRTDDAESIAALPPGTIKVGGEMGRRIDVTANNNLLALDVENDFLKPLRERKRESGYTGLGKLIDASVRLSLYTQDERVLALKRHIISETLKTQEPDGYIGYMKPGRRVFTLWDLQEIAYIFYGLTMDHRYYGETASLEGARKLADVLIATWNATPQKDFGKPKITIQMPLAGLDDALLAIGEETKDPKYVAFMRDMRKSVGWDDQIVIGRWGLVEGHVYTYLAQSVAMLRLDRLQPDPQMIVPTRNLLHFLRDGNGMAITGAIGDHECFHDTQQGTINLGETCASVYTVFWLDELMRREGKALYGDMMERVIFNTLFGAQSREGRNLRYYTAFDGPRHFFPEDTYCCPNNYRRGIAALSDHIYYRVGNGVALNLYTESSTRVTLEGGIAVKLRQDTKYPSLGQVAVYVDPSSAVRFPLWLRIPAWCADPHVSVNGQPSESHPVPGQFLVLHREWKPGDQVLVDLPMKPRWIKGRQAQLGHVALMHGPQVFCLNRTRNPELKDIDLRLLVIDPQTLEGPVADDSVRPGGLAFRVKAWKPGGWYPFEDFAYTLTLTEFPDPNGEATYFMVPDPNDSRFVADELLAPTVRV